MNIFVGNLSFHTTDEDVRQLFAAYGAVGTVDIMTDRHTGRPRGFGFVEMSNSREAQSAIEGLQARASKEALNVNEQPREPRVSQAVPL